VLQCVAVCCSVLQCVAVHEVMQHRHHNAYCIECHTHWTHICCSVLQCVVVCCSVLQCVAVRHIVLQCAAVCCSTVLKVTRVEITYVAVCHICCSVLQCVAVCYSTVLNVTYIHVLLQCQICYMCECHICCSVLQRVWLRGPFKVHKVMRHRHYVLNVAYVAVCCSVLQCVAVCCSVLQCTKSCGIDIVMHYCVECHMCCSVV